MDYRRIASTDGLAPGSEAALKVHRGSKDLALNAVLSAGRAERAHARCCRQ
jgi:hypothetical protein